MQNMMTLDLKTYMFCTGDRIVSTDRRHFETLPAIWLINYYCPFGIFKLYLIKLYYVE